MIFSDAGPPYFGIDEAATDKDAKRSLDQAFGDVLDVGIETLGDPRLSSKRRNDIVKALTFRELSVLEIADDLAPLGAWTRGLVLSRVEDLLRESVAIAYAAALVSDEAMIVAKVGLAQTMRAARTSPERERAIDEAIAKSDPSAKKRVDLIIADVARAGFAIKRDAVKKRLEKCAS